MTGDRAPRRSLLTALLFVPTVILLVLAVIALATSDPREIVTVTPVATILLVGAIALALGAGIVLWTRSRRAVAVETAAAAAADAAGAAHRLFLDRLDHELKNPVTAIRAAVAASAEPTPQLAAIDGQVARLSRLVGDLRKVSELQTTELEAESVDPALLITDVVDAVRESEPREITVSVPAAPWPLPPVVGDADLLFVALFNVVANAVKYSEPSARIEIRGQEEAGFVQIEVADTGRGIPTADLPVVMEELARASNARDRPGNGLGLALARVIVQRHGGRISITSREGLGTSVRMGLPVRR